MTGISPRNLEVVRGANLENLPKMDLTNFTNKLEPEIVRSGQSPQDNYNFFGSGGITCPCGFGLRGRHRLLDSDDEMPPSPELDLMLEPERPDPEDELKKLKLSKNFTIDYYAGKPNRKLKKKHTTTCQTMQMLPCDQVPTCQQ